MADWKSRLAGDPIEWLLEPGNPSVRYLTLTRLLDEPETSPIARDAKRSIMLEGAVPQILERQREGSWNEPGHFYEDKYRGTVWQLIILAEHMADGRDPRIAAACDYLLDSAQDRESHGFAYRSSARMGGGHHHEVIPCLTGNVVFSLVRLGRLADERVQRAIEWITRYQRFDDGIAATPQGWPYDRYEMCWGTHTCHMGVVKALKALAEIPSHLRTPAVGETIRRATDHLLAHHIFKRSHDLSKTSKPGWLRLQFPLMYQTDILEIAGLLAGVGCRDERMSEAVEKIVSKQNAEGRWILQSSFNGRFHVDIEEVGNPSKWVTLGALRLIKTYYG